MWKIGSGAEKKQQQQKHLTATLNSNFKRRQQHTT